MCMACCACGEFVLNVSTNSVGHDPECAGPIRFGRRVVVQGQGRCLYHRDFIVVVRGRYPHLGRGAHWQGARAHVSGLVVRLPGWKAGLGIGIWT